MLGLSINIHEKFQNESTNLKYCVEKPRRHWRFSKHCEHVFVAKPLPNVPLLTDGLKFYWHVYASKGRFEKCYQKDLNHYLDSTLTKALRRKNICLKHVLLTAQLINVDRFDALDRKNVIFKASKFVWDQSNLELACFEGLRLKRTEGYQLLSALEKSCASIHYLCIWRLFKRNEYSLPNEYFENYFPFHYHWLSAIENLKCLETVALNYSYIASDSGHLLVHLTKQLGKKLKWLQLLCLYEEMPETLNKDGKLNAITIPDCAWMEARKRSPYLKVQIILLGIAEYDLHKRFLTQNIPLQAIVLSTNLEIPFHKPCMIDCTLKTIYLWYHRALVELHLNLWDHREMLDYHLRKIFACLPNLKTFEFLGGVRDAVTICTMCCQIRLGICDVKKVYMQVQRLDDMKSYEIDWLSKVRCLLSNFRKDFEIMGVTFEVESYPY